jgi:voltage-gated potassium channel
MKTGPEPVISKKIVRLCYFLDGSPRYCQVKQFFYGLLSDPHARMRSYFDASMIVLVIASVALLVYQIEHDLGWLGNAFEIFIVTVFITEYLLRAWVYNDSRSIIIERFERAEFMHTSFRVTPALGEVIRQKWLYVSSPLAIIDLLAILPSFRGVRVLRIFLLFRLFKLFRYASSVSEFTKVLAEKRFELATLGLFAGFIVIASSTAIYVLEAGLPESSIDTFFDAVYWSLVTVSTVGYGDIIPETAEGRFVAMALIVSGIGVMAFFTSIIVSSFTEKLRTLREHRVFADLRHSRDFTVVCGYGRVGEVVVEKLVAENARFLILEKDPNKIERARAAGYLALQGDATSNELLERLHIEQAVRAVICTTGDDVVNVFITLTTRYLSKDVVIIARANKRESAEKLRLAGANHVVASFESVGRVVNAYIDQPVAFAALYGILSGNKGVGTDTVVVVPGSLADGKSIDAIDFPHYRLVLFGIVVSRDRIIDEHTSVFEFDEQSFHFHPPGDFVVRSNDILVLFGDDFSLNHFKGMLGKGGL